MAFPFNRSLCSVYLPRHVLYARLSIRTSFSQISYFRAFSHCRIRNISSGPVLLSEAKIKRSTARKGKVVQARNLLDQSKVQEYLDYVASTDAGATLEDLEKCKPTRHSSPDTPQYEKEYNALLDTLVRSFSKDQLRHFLRLYGLDAPVKKTKWQFAVSIIETQWAWPSLTEIQRKRRDWTEVSAISLPLDPRQSFLLLGKDGADLLALSMKYQVHITLSKHPLCLHVEGLRGSLDLLSRHVNSLMKDIQEEIFLLPANQSISSAALQQISRLSVAFVENVGSKIGKVLISHLKSEPRAALLAKKFIARALCKDIQYPLLSYAPSTSSLSSSLFQKYSLYPFMAAQSLPWTISAGGVFRIRRVGDWLDINTGEVTQSTGGLAEQSREIITLDGKNYDLRNLLAENFPSSSHSDISKTLVASPGHLLLYSLEHQRTAIAPPLGGSSPLSNFTQWINDGRCGRIFNPCIPQPLLSSPPEQQEIIYRLVYTALDKVPTSSPLQKQTLQFEVILGLKEFDTEKDFLPADKGIDNNGKEQRTLSDQSVEVNPICFMRTETSLDVIMPDRPMDLRLSLITSASLAKHQWPQDIQDHFIRLKDFLSRVIGHDEQPEVPAIISHFGVTYGLRSSSSVRHNVKAVSVTSDTGAFQVKCEHIKDIDSNQGTVNCEIVCEDFMSAESWKKFMSQCDWLTTRMSQAVKPLQTNTFKQDESTF